MFACLDVQYSDTAACVGCVLFQDWPDSQPEQSFTFQLPAATDYQPGQFYRRELPCLLKALDSWPIVPNMIIVDGYVWLGTDKPGLGYHLYQALSGRCPVIGIAKAPFSGNDIAVPVVRGRSAKPLFVTTIDLPSAIAVSGLEAMHGPHRVPFLLKYADQLARGTVKPSP